jgi:hypothetical protein
MRYSPTTALHEAGHAVAALNCGLEIVSVEVFPNGGGHTRWDGNPSAMDLLVTLHAGRSADWRHACLAGECLAFDWYAPNYATDRRSVDGVLRRLRKDVEKTARTRRYVNDTLRRLGMDSAVEEKEEELTWPESRHKVLRRARFCADWLTEIRWAQVTRLASGLERYGRLKGGEVNELLRERDPYLASAPEILRGCSAWSI